MTTQNVRRYAPKRQPPANFTFQRLNSREKLGVWAALVGDGTLIGPFFFDGNLNGNGYLRMLRTDILPIIAQKFGQHANGAIRQAWWAQDGAPCHRSNAVRRELQTRFHQRVVALGHPREWPANSPDLTPMDFFVWGFVKNNVYKTPPADMNDLRRRITAEFATLTRGQRMIRRSFDDMTRRANVCIRRGGLHVEGRDAH